MSPSPPILLKARQGESTGEFIQFVGMAQGSLAEAETQLIIANRLGFLPDADSHALLQASDDISRMLMALSTSLGRRKAAAH